MIDVNDVRTVFRWKLMNEDFVTDKTGVKTIEIINASFLANEPSIFGEVNWDYVNREIEWYEGMSRNVNDIPPPIPKIWLKVSDESGFINSNYGWCIYSKENGSQYKNVLKELLKNPFSRRAVMIYNRPLMHYDYNTRGMSDFICTDAVQYLIRNNSLHAVVRMRSNDAVFGYKNDRAWQIHVQCKLLDDLRKDPSMKDLQRGHLYWNAGSLHVYERHFVSVSEEEN